ncbi:Trp biosynthesis-associated membrane protein [Nocardioides piscis]|uniref:Trp biosynthesis-associated membrane protein n=1 Tax=Nocardioides piscis TaxID=2714938 RepID=A0A6G7YHL7_9ACTN|nr:Trp biosynthesis-associated membrane protein [Nocardioides piscis]QIK76270.1 Trp biosynthesis-associated membrane protein [Nocardioides piscis]
MAERRTFGPVLLVGLASAALAALAGTKRWADLGSATYDSTSETYRLESGQLLTTGAAQVPLVGALGLVLLACWGVLLVTRGRVRRGVALLALVTACGLLATTVVGLVSVPDALLDAVREAGVSTDVTSASRTLWPWAALVGAVASVAAAAVAVRHVSSWPEMGSRYDAPAAQARAAAEPEDNLDIWRALDEGHDPTRPSAP